MLGIGAGPHEENLLLELTPVDGVVRTSARASREKRFWLVMWGMCPILCPQKEDDCEIL